MPITNLFIKIYISLLSDNSKQKQCTNDDRLHSLLLVILKRIQSIWCALTKISLIQAGVSRTIENFFKDEYNGKLQILSDTT